MVVFPFSKMISAQEWIDLSLSPTGMHSVTLDVRSEGEFAEASLPGTQNLPILKDSERHQVGWTYKNQGQLAAVELGHRLVAPERELRVRQWVEAIRQQNANGQPGFVMCWRGGMRSQIATEWMNQAGVSAVRIQGGYKAIRKLLLSVLLEKPFPQVFVVSGYTGSGKTELIKNLPSSLAIDLEGLACHRGSAFGGYWDCPQPAQATFENHFAWHLLKKKQVIVESESRLIGKIGIPMRFKQAMQEAPVVLLQVPFEKRVENIIREYVETPLNQGVLPEFLLAQRMDSLLKVKKKLGGAETDRIAKMLQNAFEGRVSHESWVIPLLKNYYDGMYRFAFDRQKREIVFEGNEEACRSWIIDSLRP